MNGADTGMFGTDEVRWEAVTKRDPRAADAFVYAVATTGIYCRPACSSRLPARCNVRFFSSSAEAEGAGFRPCRRCRPDSASTARHADAVRRACSLVDEADEPPTLEELAEAAGLSPFHFHRVFKEVVGVTPREYAQARRRSRLQEGLSGGTPVARAIYEAGFGSSSRVYEDARKLLGMRPAEYRNGAAGLPIRFTVTETVLGWMLVAATERGVCSIEFGDTPEGLTSRLRARFPKAELRPDDPGFAAWVSRIAAFLEAPRGALDLPLDIQGTAFQQRVWSALREIPAGTTLSYTELAERIGSPAAARAVARACASNPVAVAVPCHRVVRGNGDLSGYRWGVERKRSLLEREAREIGETLAGSTEAQRSSGTLDAQ